MPVELAFIAVGLGVILISGDLLVRGAVSLATSFQVPRLIISLTIVAFGASAPEFFIAAKSVAGGNPGLAVGSIIGSNIANLLLVLGLPALVYPITARTPGLRPHLIALLVATLAFALLAYFSGGVNRATGTALVFGIVAYVGLMWRRATHGAKDDPVVDDVEEYADEKKLTPATFLYLLTGFVGLPIGAGLLTTHGAALAEVLGLRQEAIGLSIVAIGAALPELATVLAAAFRGKSDVALGSAVGSNIFNILAVGGVAGLFGGFEIGPMTLQFEMPALLASTAAIALFIYSKRDIGRAAGGLLLAAYAGFLILLAVYGGGGPS